MSNGNLGSSSVRVETPVELLLNKIGRLRGLIVQCQQAIDKTSDKFYGQTPVAVPDGKGHPGPDGSSVLGQLDLLDLDVTRLEIAVRRLAGEV